MISRFRSFELSRSPRKLRTNGMFPDVLQGTSEVLRRKYFLPAPFTVVYVVGAQVCSWVVPVLDLRCSPRPRSKG